MLKFKLNNEAKTLSRNTWINQILIYLNVLLTVQSSLIVVMVRVSSLFLLSLLSLLHTSLASSCCLTKVVQGTDDLAGTYSLYTGAASFLPSCM